MNSGVGSFAGHMTGDRAQRVVYRVCTRKRGYALRGTAEAVCARMELQGSIVRPYLCPFCGEHHVGHQPSLEGLLELAATIRFLNGHWAEPLKMSA